jgi:microcompartment protein PduM
MDAIVEKIIKCLKDREKAKLCLSLQEPFSVTDKVFIRYQTIELKGVGVLFLSNLARLDSTDEQVAWFLTGLDYGCDFHLYLSFDAIALLPLALFGFPIRIFSKNGKRLVYFSNQVISFRQVALLSNQTLLIRQEGQILTALAQEVLEKNAVQQIERVAYVNGKSRRKYCFNTEK